MTQNKRPVRPGAAPQRRPVNAPPQRPAYGQTRPVQPQRSMPVRPAPRRSLGPLPYDFWPMIAGSVVLIAVCFLLQLYLPDVTAATDSARTGTVAEVHASGGVRINELMSSNSATLVDENGITADWIEIANVGNSAVNLSGYALAKDEGSTSVFTFPSHVLQPGECTIVFADSTLRSNAGERYHAPFKLSSQGGSLMLFSSGGTAIDAVNFPALSSDTAYVRKETTVWAADTMATPGQMNTQEGYNALHATVAGAGVEITEVVATASQYGADENGMCHDYIELHNATGAAIDLSGWFISDTIGQPTKWRLPDGFTLQPDEYRIIHCSGMDRASASHPHANFGLSSEGEAAILADREGRIVDQTKYDLLKTDQAWQKQSDGTWTTSTPTPAAANP